MTPFMLRVAELVDAVTAGPFEFLIAIGFSFEYLLTNLLFVPFMSGAGFNGDLPTMTFGFSAQSDESRHMTFGLEAITFLLEQDPDNVPIVQAWIDKWFWRGYRLLALVSQMLDYMLPRKVMSWKEAFELYFEQQMLGNLFPDLAFNTTVPEADEMEWLSKSYPDTFDRLYKPLWDKAQRVVDGGERYHFYSDGCTWIEEVATDTRRVVVELDRDLEFNPGQYLAWHLPTTIAAGVTRT